MPHETSRIVLAATLALGLASFAAPAARAGDAMPVDAIAIYNRGAAVVADTHTVALDAGAQQIGWPLSASAQPATLWLAGNGVALTSLRAHAQSSRGDGQTLLAARIGEPVTLLRDTGPGKTRSRQARLVGLAGDSALVRVDGRIERLTADSPWRLSWPAGGHRKDAGLRLDVVADAAGAHKLTATYQIDGPRWQVSYTGRFDAKTRELSLRAMAVIDNSSGTRLAAHNAWLVAGDVARAGDGGQPRPLQMARSRAKMAASSPRASGHLYRYRLGHGLDLRAGATAVVSLMAPLQVRATRHYRFSHSALAESRGQRRHAAVYLRFKNTGGQPLPAGVVRVYAAGRPADLMGEARIDDTPTGAPVAVTLGKSFDLVATHRVVESKQQKSDRRQAAIEITVHNAGAQPAPVALGERLPRGAAVVSASRRPEKRQSADRATWTFDVPANGATTLRYTIRWPTHS